MEREREISSLPRVAVMAPYYDHESTLRSVVEKVLAVLEASPLMLVVPVIVVDDGSRVPACELLHGLDRVVILRQEQNRGKGAAILLGAAKARELGATHLITIDADGQHDAAEIPIFLAALQATRAAGQLALLVGRRDFSTPNVPAASRFGRAFSNFWLRVQTGIALGDSQSGFRLYPLAIFEHLRCTETRYSFEIEVLAKAAWAGVALCDVDISVSYLPRGERVSHFRVLADNARIAWLNTRLTMRCLLPWPHKKLAIASRETVADRVTVVHPWRSLRLLLAAGATPRDLALAAGLGVLVGALPLFGVQTVAVLGLAAYLRLNKAAALAANQLCMPPLVPALCVELGYFFRHGRFLTEVSLQTLGYEAPYRLWEWLLGGLALGPVFAALVAGFVFATAALLHRHLRGLHRRDNPRS